MDLLQRISAQAARDARNARTLAPPPHLNRSRIDRVDGPDQATGPRFDAAKYANLTPRQLVQAVNIHADIIRQLEALPQFPH